MLAQTTDEQLLILLKTDYRAAFRHLYQFHFKMVEYLVTQNSGNTFDAEDVFQETMVALFNKSREVNFELTCSVKTFVYSIARNLWLKKLRDNRHEVKIKDCEKYEQLAVEEDNELAPGREMQVRNAIEQLGDGCRKILVLFYYVKKSMQEIADELGYTNADNVKNQKYKCLQQLKSKLSNHAG